MYKICSGHFFNYFIKIAIYTHYELQHLFITLLRLKIITSYQSSTLPVDINQALFGKKVEIHDKIYKDNFQKFTEEKNIVRVPKPGKTH